ncbi:MAG: SDR family NAD(P)-dependent oxidoreductase, partial [Legionellaceae bacterium]|nr:SDR family NAD(P)-dependent oxidoreductase [Legionellaceae bacterium]
MFDLKTPYYLLTISAKSKTSLQKRVLQFSTLLTENDTVRMGDIAFTSSVRRRHEVYRTFVLGCTRDELIHELSRCYQNVSANKSSSYINSAWFFSGQIDDYSQEQFDFLYQASPMYRNAVEACKSCFNENSTLFSSPQVTLFVTNYALAMCWLTLGLTPNYLLGEGIGEYVSAVISGVMRLEDGLMLAYHRPLELTVNSLDSFHKMASQVNYYSPCYHFISSFTGKIIRHDEINADYWVSQLCEAPHLLGGINTLREKNVNIYLDVGLGEQCNALISKIMHEAESTESVIYITNFSNGMDPWKRFMNALGQLYVAGCSINWELIYPSLHHKKIILPAYQFEQERYWFESKHQETLSLETSLSSGFLRSKLSSPGRDKVFQVELSLSDYAYLADHVVYGHVIFPGAGYLEICFEVMAELGLGHSYRVEDVSFERALSLPSEGFVLLQVIVSGEGTERELVIYSTKDSLTWQRHCRAVLGAVRTFPQKQLNVSAYLKRSESVLSGEAYYNTMGSLGIALSFGPSFQGIQAVHQLKDGVLAEILLAEHRDYLAHPAVLDSCLQSIVSLWFGESYQSKTYIPVAMKVIWLQGVLSHHVWVKVDKASFMEKESRLIVSLEIYNTSGQLIGLIDELTLAEVTSEQLAITLQDTAVVELPSYYEWQWVPYCGVDDYVKPVPSETAQKPRWLLIHDAVSLAEALRQQMHDKDIVLCWLSVGEEFSAETLSHPEGFDRIVYASFGHSLMEESVPVLTESRSIHLLEVIQTLIRHYTQENTDFPALDIVTGVDLSSSALWGIGRTLQNEYTDWHVRLLECNEADGIERIAYALWASSFDSSDENQLKLESNQVSVCRMQASVLNEGINTLTLLPLSKEGVYLITGGLSGIGYAVCEWLVGQGITQIALLSRRSASDEQRNQFLVWAEQGHVVISYAVDVSDALALEGVYRTIQQEQGPVKTVIHSAGVLADATILNQTSDSYHRVYQSKVHGAWHLHELTRHDALDNFIVFSSMTSLLGTPGQSNYAAANLFLDTLIHHRRALGLRGLSINWGAWGQTGIAVTRLARLDSTFMQSLTTDDGLRALHHVVSYSDRVGQIGVMLMDWGRYQ